TQRMRSYRLTLAASQDLEEISDYIAEKNPLAAVILAGKIKSLCQSIANMPEMGRLRSELSPHLRSMPEGKYLIFYRPTEAGVDVIRILHSARDIDSLF